MAEPHFPALPALLLHTLAALGWQALTGAADGHGLLLGTFADREGANARRAALYLIDGCWAADVMVEPGEGVDGPYLLTQGTAHVLMCGQLTGANDEVLYNGKAWRIQALEENGRLISRAVPP